MRARSLGGRLAVGLSLVAVLGALVLLGLVALEYGVGADPPLTAMQLAHEVADHVVAPLIILLGLVAIAGALVIRSGLRPLREAAIDVDLAAQTAPRGFRIDQDAFPSEAQPFAAAINRLLGRLDAAAEAQEAFAADAAHELKTPLTILSLELDKLPGESAMALRGDVAALSRLVDQLLMLARLDAQTAAETPKTSIDPRTIATDLIAALAPIALKTGRHLAFEDAGATDFPGHSEAVTAALRNLAENALRITPEHGTVTLIAGPGARLRIRDEGPGLSTQRLTELSQRGVRADHASPSGAGLGLSIVARIMMAHGGALRADEGCRELLLDFEGATQ
ncbi:MAG: HAMP domain-containing histidine kinase [Hyphomonadaceae bacterium]|nr:HAMP domain-containing histidine kinase [Hyphomonadaceae bacterium]